MSRLDFARVISRFVDQRAEERTLAVEAPKLATCSRDAKAVPHPNHAGSRQRFCVQAKTHGIARSAPRSSEPAGRRAGRDPISSRESSSIGVNCRKNGRKCGSSWTSALYARSAGSERASSSGQSLVRRLGSGDVRERRQRGSPRARPRGFDRRARAAPYLKDTVSPCSVSLSRPGGCPGGCARIAAWVGPPPRPGAAAAAVEDRELDAALGRERA